MMDGVANFERLPPSQERGVVPLTLRPRRVNGPSPLSHRLSQTRY